MAVPTFCAGVADLAARYEHFVVDQWGVLHDGLRALAGLPLDRLDRAPRRRVRCRHP